MKIIKDCKDCVYWSMDKNADEPCTTKNKKGVPCAKNKCHPEFSQREVKEFDYDLLVMEDLI